MKEASPISIPLDQSVKKALSVNPRIEWVSCLLNYVIGSNFRIWNGEIANAFDKIKISEHIVITKQLTNLIRHVDNIRERIYELVPFVRSWIKYDFDPKYESSSYSFCPLSNFCKNIKKVFKSHFREYWSLMSIWNKKGFGVNWY